MVEVPISAADTRPKVDAVAWYRDYARRELVRSHEKGARPDTTGLQTLKAKVDPLRAFLLNWPSCEKAEKKVVFLRVLDGDRGPLFDLLHDPEDSERFSEQFRGGPPDGIRFPKNDYRPHVNVYRLSGPAGLPAGRVCYYHVDSATDNRYVFSRWDCLVLRDSLDQCILYGPTRSSTAHPGKIEMEDLYLASGELLQRRRGDRMELATFVDPEGRPLGTYRHVGSLEGTLTLVPDDPAFVTLVHGIFFKMYGARLGGYRRQRSASGLSQ